MPMLPPITPDQIHKAARQLTQLRPSYTDLLAFYAAVFTQQEKAKGDIDLAPMQLPPETVAARRRKSLPLVEVSGLAFDLPTSHGLLETLCALAATQATEMHETAAAVAEARARGDLDPQALFRSFLRSDDVYLQDTAERIGSDAKTLGFLAYHSIQPSIELGAAQLASYLDTESVWQKGYCPVCGSAPGLAVLGQEGHRVVVCSFCRHQWQAPRLFCVFCENTTTDELHYVFTEEERDLRIDVCERCRHYIKTVQRREVSRPLFPPLEQVASLHLDMIAAEKGFRSGMGLTFEA